MRKDGHDGYISEIFKINILSKKTATERFGNGANRSWLAKLCRIAPGTV